MPRALFGRRDESRPKKGSELARLGAHLPARGYFSKGTAPPGRDLHHMDIIRPLLLAASAWQIFSAYQWLTNPQEQVTSPSACAARGSVFAADRVPRRPANEPSEPRASCRLLMHVAPPSAGSPPQRYIGTEWVRRSHTLRLGLSLRSLWPGAGLRPAGTRYGMHRCMLFKAPSPFPSPALVVASHALLTCP